MHQDEGVGVPGPPTPAEFCLPLSSVCISEAPSAPLDTPACTSKQKSQPPPYAPAHSGPWPSTDLGLHTPVGRAVLHGGREGAYGALRVGSGPLGREVRWGVLLC